MLITASVELEVHTKSKLIPFLRVCIGMAYAGFVHHSNRDLQATLTLNTFLLMRFRKQILRLLYVPNRRLKEMNLTLKCPCRLLDIHTSVLTLSELAEAS